MGQLLIVATATTALFTLRSWGGYSRVVIGGGLCLIERTANVSILPF